MFTRLFCVLPKILRYIVLTSVALAALAFAQLTGPINVGTIAFFGYDGVDQDKVRASLPFRVGDSIPVDKLGEELKQTSDAISKAIGSAPTDIAPVCCDAQGKWIVYVGLAGRSNHIFMVNPAPTGTERLPAEVLSLVTNIEKENMNAVLAGKAKEDDTRGYALVAYLPERKLQETLRHIALKHVNTILNVLETCSNEGDRAAAAMALGYARRSDRQIQALVAASRDADGGVRNNATRALLVMAGSDPRTARKIPAGNFIAMLNSGIWTDRNKGTGLILMLTASRDPALLKRLSAEALPSLIEMANWDPGHAESAQVILGRIAGMTDSQIKELIGAGKVSEIIDAASKISA